MHGIILASLSTVTGNSGVMEHAKCGLDMHYSSVPLGALNSVDFACVCVCVAEDVANYALMIPGMFEVP